jgi:hypothetical protein
MAKRVLLVRGHREPEFRERDAVVREQSLELRHLPEESLILLVGTEAHDLLNPGAVIPRAVEQDDLPGSRQVRYVAPEIPLPTFALSGDIKCGNPRRPGIQVLHEALDGTALTSSIPALEDNHKAAARILHPILQLEQFDLEQPFLVLIFLMAQPLSIGIIFPPGIHQASVSVTEHRVILV